MRQQQRIFAFHLLNDRSGSPKVLRQLIPIWLACGKEVHLHTNRLTGNGFLAGINGIHYHHGWYKFSANPWLRLVYFSISQLLLMLKMFRQINSNDVIYVNTVLPFGAAILGKLKGARVIYHIHETKVNPAILNWFLFSIVRRTANDIINVSRFVQDSHGITSASNYLLYNTIEESFVPDQQPDRSDRQLRNVLMVCSLKWYKGISEYQQMALDHENYCFRLVLNATDEEVATYFKGHPVPANLSLYSSQTKLQSFFEWADVIVNLSRPDGWVETFGLTILEGMAFGLPSIVPPAGGVLEVIEEGKTGFAVDCRDRKQLNAALNAILGDRDSYLRMSDLARERLEIFREGNLIAGVNRVFQTEGEFHFS